VACDILKSPRWAWYAATMAPAPMIWTLVSWKFDMRTVLIPGVFAVLSDSS
jgi:hypothetical protein